MPFAFSQTEPARIGQVSRFDIPYSQWMGLQYGAGEFSQVGPRLENLIADVFDDSEYLTPEQANEQFGIPGKLKYDTPIRANAARARKERKIEELRLISLSDAASHSAFSLKAASGVGALIAGSMMHPVDAAINFLPFVGSEAKAMQIARVGASGSLARAFARGVITEESIGSLPLLRQAPLFTRSVIEAGLGNVAFEIPNYMLAVRDQAVYGPEDLAANLVIGTAVGSTLGFGLSKILGRAASIYEKLDPRTQENMFKEAVGAALRDEVPDLSKHVLVDENIIREQVKFNLAEAEAEAIRILDREPSGQGPGVPAANEQGLRLIAEQQIKAGELSEPEADIIQKLLKRIDEGDTSVQTREELADFLGYRYDATAIVPPEGLARGGQITDSEQRQLSKLIRDKDKVSKDILRAERRLAEARAEPTEPGQFSRADGLEKRLAELREKSAELTARIQEIQKRVPQEPQPERAVREPTEQQLVNERQKRIKDLVDRMRREHEATFEERLSNVRQAEIDKQLKEGKVLRDEQVEEFLKTEKPEVSQQILAEDAQNLEGNLKSLVEGLEEGDPLRVNVEKGLQAVNENAFKSRESAIDAAIPCLINA